MERDSNIAEFAPGDVTDGRAELDWKTRYPPEALKEIRIEVAYLIILLFGLPTSMLIVLSGAPVRWFGLAQPDYDAVRPFILAWLGGSLGGTVFDVKWMYHMVAKNMWHLDRRLWRFLAPHLSGASSLGFVLLIASGLIKIFDSNVLVSTSAIVGLSILVGLFSDMATAKMAEVAKTMFGSPTK